MMFEASTPVFGRGFFDREEALTRIEKVTEALQCGYPRWLAILGARKIGKTSLLAEAARRQQNRLSFALTDVQMVSPVSDDFFRYFGLRVVDTLCTDVSGVSVEGWSDDYHGFRDVLNSLDWFRNLEPLLRRRISGLVDAPISNDFIRAVLDLPERLAETFDRPLIVAIDEFQELAHLADKRRARRANGNPFPLMRGVWQKHRKVCYVISGSSRRMLTQLVTSKDSPFFQHFELMELEPFDATSSHLMLQDKLAEYSPSDEWLNKVHKLLGGHPFYLQLFGEVLLDVIDSDKVMDDHVLKVAMQRLLFRRTGRLALFFEREYQKIVGRSAPLAAVLDTLAQGPKNVTSIATKIGASSGSTVHYLERLTDVVYRHPDQRYGLNDTVFALWLRWRSPGGSLVPMRTLGNEAEAAVALELARSGFDLVYQSRGSRGAFDLLATRGSLQLGVQVKSAHSSPRMATIELRRMEGDAQSFGWIGVVAAYSKEDGVRFYDPTVQALKPRQRYVSLTPKALVENVLLWAKQKSMDLK